MPKPVEVKTPSDREVVVIRTFDAPAALVWDAHTKPELLKRWMLGPPGWSMPYCTVDLRVGGKYRYVWHEDATGAEFGSYGEHLELETHRRMVTTERMDGLDGQPVNHEQPVEAGEPAINTLTLVEHDGRTTLTASALYPTAEIRDMAFQSGMTDGMAVSYDNLDEVLAAEGVG
ncbi:SRPBCC family protein [uncultured Phenylobacterium sp.]|uniref:SRPBCC family protein n=1 Tax=uncultured Phenylobacterium sp. TaxID=349273 RepID=UPI0025F0D822|nr:SRPBCC family protein [uncultured Phenylobacterium sp.]